MAGFSISSRRLGPRLVSSGVAGMLTLLSGCALLNGGHDAPTPAAAAPSDAAPAPPSAPAAPSTISPATPSGSAVPVPAPTVATPAPAPPKAAKKPPASVAAAPMHAAPKAAPKAATAPASAAAVPVKPAAAIPAPTAAAPAKPSQPPLDLAALEQRLKDTKAIGVFTKLSLKNQVDDLLDEFKKYHQAGGGSPPPPALRSQYDLLMIKVLSLLQDGDPQLASSIASSREALWDILKDPNKFAKI